MRPRHERRDRITILAGLTALLMGAVLARRREVTRLERRWFGTVNRATPVLFVPAWVVMQLGSLGGVLSVAGVLRLRRPPRLGRDVALWGTVTWVLAKLVKRFVGRERPDGALGTARILGPVQTGLGYPSGHAAVAATVASVAAPHLVPTWRLATWTAALLVGPIRMYVGAHLPLDVAGGIALGLAVGSISRLTSSSA